MFFCLLKTKHLELVAYHDTGWGSCIANNKNLLCSHWM